MIKVAFFDTKPYDKIWFDKYKNDYDISIKYFDTKLYDDTSIMAKGFDAVCVFVNDDINKDVVNSLYENNVKIIALRCAGYNNVDIKSAKDKVKIARVSAYSPHAIAEHAMAMILCLNRKLHKAYIRTRDFNFSLNTMTGFDLRGKTIGIIGTGKIGEVFANISKGFGMEVLAYDPYTKCEGLKYVSLDEIFEKSDIISLNCPLTKENKHMINEESINKMKDGIFIVNTSRGALVDSDALIKGLKEGKIGNAALDVYEEEQDLFFEDMSNETLRDEKLATLLSMPNVLITSHQAFLTSEALENIAQVTLKNINSLYLGENIKNEIKYEYKNN